MKSRRFVLFTALLFCSACSAFDAKKSDVAEESATSETAETAKQREMFGFKPGYTPYDWAKVWGGVGYNEGTNYQIVDNDKGTIFFAAPKWNKNNRSSSVRNEENDLAFILRSKTDWERENPTKHIVAITIVPGSATGSMEPFSSIILGLLAQYTQDPPPASPQK